MIYLQLFCFASEKQKTVITHTLVHFPPTINFILLNILFVKDVAKEMTVKYLNFSQALSFTC